MPAAQTALIHDLSPRLIDICLARRDSFPFGFVLTDNTDPANPVPINLTGNTFQFTVRETDDPLGTLVFQLAQSNTPTTDGLILFTPTVLQMTLTPNTYFYDVEWTAGAEIRTPIKGEFVIVGDIT